MRHDGQTWRSEHCPRRGGGWVGGGEKESFFFVLILATLSLNCSVKAVELNSLVQEQEAAPWTVKKVLCTWQIVIGGKVT
jgi:hypothetical protein